MRCLTQVYWTHNGEQIEEDDVHTVETIEDVNTCTSTLTIQAVTPQEAGTYKCIAINEAGEETVSASLIVKGSTQICVCTVPSTKNVYYVLVHS